MMGQKAGWSLELSAVRFQPQKVHCKRLPFAEQQRILRRHQKSPTTDDAFRIHVAFSRVELFLLAKAGEPHTDRTKSVNRTRSLPRGCLWCYSSSSNKIATGSKIHLGAHPLLIPETEVRMYQELEARERWHTHETCNHIDHTALQLCTVLTVCAEAGRISANISHLLSSTPKCGQCRRKGNCRRLCERNSNYLDLRYVTILL